MSENGKDAIIRKIKEDAIIKANSTLEEGAARAKTTIDNAVRDADVYKRDNMAESYVERDEIIKRKTTVASLEVKKLVLQAKKQVVDKAFDEAAKLIKSDEKAYKNLIERMLSFVEDGDEIVLSEFDEKLVSDEFVEKTVNKLGKKATISEKRGSFKGGIKLVGKNTDKNLTLEAELAEFRREEESIVAQILFGE